MLVLSRKKGQEITIQTGDEAVRIFIVEIRSGTVRLGVEAPPEIPVHRREVYEAIQREQGDKDE